MLRMNVAVPASQRRSPGREYGNLVLIDNTEGSMPRTTSITIGEKLDSFIARMIESGRYGSTSEVVRSALRLLEQQESQMDALRLAIDAGERSGESELTLREITEGKMREQGL